MAIGSGTSQHAFFVITRADGFKQVLALDPVPFGNALQGTAQGTFIAGNETKENVAHPTERFELTPPNYPGLDRSQALTRYGNELVAGAHAWNEHPLRYDVPAGEGYNSNSWAASLVIAKGGEAGLADVRRIAEKMDGNMPLLRESAGTKPPWQRGDELRESENVVQAIDKGIPIAPGFHNASIPRDRFESGPVHDNVAKYPKPDSIVVNVGKIISSDRGEAGIHDVGTYLGTSAQEALNALSSTVRKHFEATPGPTHSERSKNELTRIPGQPIHVVRNGTIQEIGIGYAQKGRITNILGDRVIQNTGRGDVTYSLSELAAQSRDPAALERTLRNAYDTQTQAAISYGRDGSITATDLGQQQLRVRNIDIDR